MNRLYFPKFNIDLTLNGGQAFNWQKFDEYYYGVFSECIIKVKYENETLFWQTYPVQNDLKLVEKIFRIDFDYETMLAEISKDEFVNVAIKKNPGLRLLQQDFDQTLISFIVSQNSNIPKIKRSLNLISESIGREIEVDDHKFYLFPKLVELKYLKESDFFKFGVGYRAKYLQKCIKEVLEKDLSNRILKLNYKDAKSELLSLHGVGDKVADCILVFSLAFDEVTPLDLWARRAFITTYSLDTKIKYSDLLEFINKKFGKYSAWTGQFLFEYFRLKSNQDIE